MGNPADVRRCRVAYNDDTVIVASRNVLSTELADGAAILLADWGQYYGLEGVARTIWRSIQEPRTVASLRRSILEVYGVSAEEFDANLQSFLDSLVTEELIVVQQP